MAEELRDACLFSKTLFNCPDNFIQRVLKEVNSKDLVLAMRGANEDVNTRIYKNMSKRAAEMIKEEMEIMGPVRLKEVEKGTAEGSYHYP